MNFAEAKGGILSNRALLNNLKNENIKRTLIKEIDKRIELLGINRMIIIKNRGSIS